jgi:formylglycine-generating enzyme required for sulfatase activity
MISLLPPGFNLIPAGQFVAGAHSGEQIAAFGMKATPVTNAEFGEVGRNRYVLLDHDWGTGETRLRRAGESVEEVAGPDLCFERVDFDQGDILILGSTILLKMVENPSAQYDGEKRVFSGANQPAVGIAYFHAEAWCLLKSLESGGEYQYDLPTDLQYEYVASDRGTKKYGTETGTLHKGKRKLAHIGEYKGTTVAVDDPRYEQDLPFGVQTTGNAWRLIKFNPDFKRPNDIFVGPYGLRGGSWINTPDYGRAAFRYDGYLHPDNRYFFVGFLPIVVRRYP